jgi:hypothetical protein
VKKKILNFGAPATHTLITNLANFNDPISFIDYAAFVFDPSAMSQVTHPENYLRRQNEVRDLVSVKGGIVLCFMRQNVAIGFGLPTGRGADSYGVLDLAAPNPIGQIRSTLRGGSGSHVELIPGARGASAGYFRVLQRAVRFAAYLEAQPANLASVGGTVLALDSVSHPIAVEFVVGPGRICVVTVPDGATGDRVGSAIARVVEAHFGGPTQIEAPPWAIDVVVPGANAHDASIATLEERKAQIETEIQQLTQKRADLLNYRVLLYGYGRSVLEPVVRSAFRLLGFGVPEPEKYSGECDLELNSDAALPAIGEIEGSEGLINVDKYRQLLDYIQAEALEDRDHKGILIGNGWRLAAPESTERQNQFSDHALRGARKNGFCLMPTAELFKAVCSVLENPQDEGLKIKIRGSILSTVGVWTFARDTAAQPASQAEPSSAG